MVSERRLEFHAYRQQGRVRLLELPDEIGRPLASVHVVPQHYDEVEGERGMELCHLLRDLVLRPVAGAVVADGYKLQRIGSVGER